MNWNPIQHFIEAEFRCPCCGEAKMDGDFVLWLDSLRERLGEPMIISSGYRCPAYNETVSHTGSDGPHTTGKAADVAISHAAAFRLLRLALADGCERVGIKQHGEGRFLHLDWTDGPSPRAWTY